MKKTALLIALLVMILLLVFSLTSCGAPTIGDVERVMAGLDSYEGEAEMTVVYYADNSKVTATSNTSTTIISEGNLLTHYYSDSTTMVAYGDGEPEEPVTSFLGYIDGHGYVRHTYGSIDQKLYSKMTPDEFIKVLNMSADDVDLTDLVGRINTVEKREDGGWTFISEAFDEKGCEEFDECTQLSLLISEEIRDIRLTIVTDEKLFVDTMTFDVSFVTEEGEDDIPELRAVMKYKNHNAATKKSIPGTNYYQIDGISDLYTIAHKLRNIGNLSEGSFTIDATQSVTFRGETTSETANYEYVFGGEPGDFWYDGEITGAISSTRTYRNGKEIYYGDVSGSRKMNETQARYYLGELVSGDFDIRIITDLISIDGKYTLVADDLDKADAELILPESGATYEDSSAAFIIEIKDGELVSIESHITIKSTYSGYSLVIKYDSVCHINPSEDNTDSGPAIVA